MEIKKTRTTKVDINFSFVKKQSWLILTTNLKGRGEQKNYTHMPRHLVIRVLRRQRRMRTQATFIRD